MARLIKELKGQRKVIFDSGRFDDWCVYVVESNGSKRAPYDEDYFSDLQQLSKKYPPNKLYNDFVKIYDKTSKLISDEVIELIDSIVRSYNPDDQVLAEQWFTVLYAGMIAEENKKFAILKKRVKRLGMYQVLVEGMSPKEAAKFSYGKKWRVLDGIMKKYNFLW